MPPSVQGRRHGVYMLAKSRTRKRFRPKYFEWCNAEFCSFIDKGYTLAKKCKCLFSRIFLFVLLRGFSEQYNALTTAIVHQHFLCCKPSIKPWNNHRFATESPAFLMATAASSCRNKSLQQGKSDDSCCCSIRSLWKKEVCTITCPKICHNIVYTMCVELFHRTKGASPFSCVRSSSLDIPKWFSNIPFSD